MIRLAISVEGPTEEEFSKAVLTTHLRSHGIEAQPILLGRARGPGAGGGNVSVGRLASEMAYLYRSFDVVTSLVDFYGFRDNRDKTAEELEALVGREIQQKIDWNPNRVLPYVQKYEFEGLLFSDVTAFSALVDAPPKSVDLLRNIRSGFATPEEGVPPKLIIFSGFLVGAGAQHCQGQIRQRDRFATTMTIPTRNGDFGATRAGSK